VIGKLGSQALVAAIQRSAHESRNLHVTFENCDVTKEIPGLFNAASPSGTYVVDLATPYGQMVVEECIFLCSHRVGCDLKRLEVDGKKIVLERRLPDSVVDKLSLSAFHKNNVDLAKDLLAGHFAKGADKLFLMLNQFHFWMDSAKAETILRKVSEIWSERLDKGDVELSEIIMFEVFRALFIINDLDQSNSMDIDEFRETLAGLGMPNFDQSILIRLMAEHDIDGSGTIDNDEFTMIMVNYFCNMDHPRGELVKKETGRPWAIPLKGTAKIEITYACALATKFDTGADEGVDSILQLIKETKSAEQREVLFEHVINSPYYYLSATQAELLLQDMRGIADDLDLIAAMMPQITCAEEVCSLLDHNLTELQKLLLRIRMGPSYNTYVGCPAGHYCLDLSKRADRRCGVKLNAISSYEVKSCKAIGLNTSQTGVLSSFRNGKYEKANVDLTGNWFGDCPNSGTLECDFSSTLRPVEGTRAISDKRFARFVKKVDLEEIVDIEEALITGVSRRGYDQFDENHSARGPLSTRRRSPSGATKSSRDNDDAGNPAIDPLSALEPSSRSIPSSKSIPSPRQLSTESSNRMKNAMKSSKSIAGESMKLPMLKHMSSSSSINSPPRSSRKPAHPLSLQRQSMRGTFKMSSTSQKQRQLVGKPELDTTEVDTINTQRGMLTGVTNIGTTSIKQLDKAVPDHFYRSESNTSIAAMSKEESAIFSIEEPEKDTDSLNDKENADVLLQDLDFPKTDLKEPGKGNYAIDSQRDSDLTGPSDLVTEKTRETGGSAISVASSVTVSSKPNSRASTSKGKKKAARTSKSGGKSPKPSSRAGGRPSKGGKGRSSDVSRPSTSATMDGSRPSSAVSSSSRENSRGNSMLSTPSKTSRATDFTSMSNSPRPTDILNSESVDLNDGSSGNGSMSQESRSHIPGLEFLSSVILNTHRRASKEGRKLMMTGRGKAVDYAMQVPYPLRPVHVKEWYKQYTSSCHHHLDIMPEEKKSFEDKGAHLANGKVSQYTLDRRKECLNGDPPLDQHGPLFALCYLKILQLQVLLPQIYFNCKQVIQMLNYFPPVGYVRVMLLQSVFNRIVDLENLFIIFDDLFTEDERKETLHRIGILNVLDPMFPDRRYKLDLRRWEDREFCKILVKLAVDEPGNNLPEQSYRWTRYDDPIPAWELPMTWTLPDNKNWNGELELDTNGPRRHGWVIFTYTSLADGCAPMISTRKDLRKRCLVGMKKIF
jgi:hypothetical protein